MLKQSNLRQKVYKDTTVCFYAGYRMLGLGLSLSVAVVVTALL